MFRRFAAALFGVLIPLGFPASATSAEALATGPLAGLDAARLVDQDGRPMSLTSLRGQIVVMNFVFTGCSATCPLQTRELVQVQRALPPAVRAHVRFVSLSIDPRNDTPAALKTFALAQGVDLDRWSFVTGEPQVVDALAASLDALDTSAPAVLHATDIRLFDSRGRPMQRYAGVPVDGARLVRELRALHDAGVDPGPSPARSPS